MDLTFQPVNSAADADGDSIAFLYKLLKDRPPEANISHREMPTYEEHSRFVLMHPYAIWYIICVPAMAGSIYLTHRNEIGIHIHGDYQRQGIATRALDIFMRMHPRPRYFANVAPGNAASHAFFGKLGRVIQHTYEITGRSQSDASA